MPHSADLSEEPAEARAFAESVNGVLDRHRPAQAPWEPGQTAAADWPGLTAALDDLGWLSLSADEDLRACAGLGGFELGRRLAPVHHVDRLLGGGPMAGDLVRSASISSIAISREHEALVRRAVHRAEPVASSEGLDVQRVLELGEALDHIDGDTWQTTASTWTAATIGYLAGLGQGALELTVDYVRQRRAFNTTLGALTPVQQLLAGAATATRGVQYLAGQPPNSDALAYAGPAVAEACAACQQVTGAIGFTLEYPLHRYTQRARALALWNDALHDSLLRAGH